MECNGNFFLENKHIRMKKVLMIWLEEKAIKKILKEYNIKDYLIVYIEKPNEIPNEKFNYIFIEKLSMDNNMFDEYLIKNRWWDYLEWWWEITLVDNYSIKTYYKKPIKKYNNKWWYTLRVKY